VKNALNLTQTSDDAWIQAELIPEAQALIDEYIGHTYQTDGTTASPATRTYDGMNKERLIIDECQSFTQVLEVQQVTYLGANQVWVQVGSITTDITADCILGPYNRPVGHFLVRRSGIDFDWGTQNYTVKGVFGNPTIPWDITRACVRLCVHWFKMRDTSYADTISETGGIHQHYHKDMPPDVVEILERHRRRHFLARSL
jgi:hypothetical protein